MDIPGNMQRSILWTAASLGGVGLFGAFAAHADLIAIAPGWGGLLVKLAQQSGKALDKERALKIATAVILGVGGFAGGIKLATTTLSYTGIGTVPAMLANAGTNAVLTYLFGRAAAHTFLEGDLQESAETLARAILVLIIGYFKPAA
jgi:hypothetical protein